MKSLENKVALVSGGSRGLGAAHVRALVQAGAKVVIADVQEKEGKALSDELDGNAIFMHLDVTNLSNCEQVIAETVKTFGGLNILVNNAGIANYGSIIDLKAEDWLKIIDVNLNGVFYGMKSAAQALINSGNGSIINVSSVNGLRGVKGLHGYVASKFAVRGVTKSAAVELAEKGVRVNSIHPGLVETAMTLKSGRTADKLQIPLGRASRPEEISSLVVFLAGDDSSYCTGAEFVVDGGLTSVIPEN